MRLQSIALERFRSVRDARLPLDSLTLLVGSNASGKSNLLDALRLLQEGVQLRGFEEAVSARGGLVHLCWKGERVREVRIATSFGAAGAAELEWVVSLQPSFLPGSPVDFSVVEELFRKESGRPPAQLLRCVEGKGWWFGSGEKQVALDIRPTECALAAASADAGFAGREVTESVRRWGFFDPSPALLRRAARPVVQERLDPIGRNLASRLKTIHDMAPETFQRIVAATRAVLGTPAEVSFRDSEDRVYLLLREVGLQFPVHQVGASSGTLRTLALLTVPDW